MKKRILFVCIHNSSRSQMAEAFINTFASDDFEAESAGLEKGNLNPYVIKAMKEIDIDISKNETNSVFDFHKEGRLYDYVIAVCDKKAKDNCPIFPGKHEMLHWEFPDPAGAIGNDDEKLQFAKTVRDQIKNKIENWLKI